MSADALPCIACGKDLKNVFEDADNQPSDGLAFTSHGHYGSTVFDPMDGQYLEISVCDDCLQTHAEAKVRAGRDRRPVLCDGVLVGWETVARPLVPFNPAAMGSFDGEDVVTVSADEVGAPELSLTHEGRRRIEWT